MVFLAPERLNLVTAGLEYLPRFPIPLAEPRNLALTLEPLLNELAAFFLFCATFCSVCFLQYGHNRFLDLGSFIQD